MPDFQGGSRRAAAVELSAVDPRRARRAPGAGAGSAEAPASHLGWRDYADDYFHTNDSGHARYAAPFLHALRSAHQGA